MSSVVLTGLACNLSIALFNAALSPSLSISLSVSLSLSFCLSLSLLTEQVDEVRRSKQNSRRTLYAFVLYPEFEAVIAGKPAAVEVKKSPKKTSLGGLSKGFKAIKGSLRRGSGAGGAGGSSNSLESLAVEEATEVDPSKRRVAVLRSYKEWCAELPLCEGVVKPANYSRLSDIEQRRHELENSYQQLRQIGRW